MNAMERLHGRPFLPMLGVLVVLAAGLAGCPDPASVTVPDLVEMTQYQALTALTLVNLGLGAVSEVYSDSVLAGLVAGQSPLAGATVATGTAVDIVMSLGPAPGEGEGEGEGEADPYTVMLPGDVPLGMALIPAGSFTMGSPSSELDRMFDESPQHLVTVGNSFLLGKTEVTKAQWQALMGTTPWADQANVLDDPDSPAVYVSWDDTQAFIDALNAFSGRTDYRLPSEAEWEYAARARTKARFSWGADSDYAAIGNYAWWAGNAEFAGQAYAHAVAAKLPNAWQLYDMPGNVWEWCRDWYHISYDGAPADGSAWEIPVGGSRIRRGGAWNSDGPFCRSAGRGLAEPDTADAASGFRIARTN